MTTHAPLYFWNVDSTPQQYLSQWYLTSFTEANPLYNPPHDDPDDSAKRGGHEREKTISYSTTEMYMMFQKAVLFSDRDIASKILDAKTPGEQKELGRKVRGFDSKVWDRHKVPIVEQGNYLKFTQGKTARQPGQSASQPEKPLGELLKGTEEHELVEASPYDRIWGIGFSAEDAPKTAREKWGQNLLGKVLERVRDRIKGGERGNGDEEKAAAL